MSVRWLGYIVLMQRSVWRHLTSRLCKTPSQRALTDVAYLGWRVRGGHVAWEAEHNVPRICHPPLIDSDLFWWCYDHIASERPSWAPAREIAVVSSYRPRRARVDQPEEVRFLAPGRVRCVAHGKFLSAILIHRAARRFQLRCGMQQVVRL